MNRTAPFAIFMSVLLLAACSGEPAPIPTQLPAVQDTVAAATDTAISPTATPEEPAAALVNGEKIALSTFEAHLARYLDAQAQASDLLVDVTPQERVLDDLIDRLLLAQGARAEGFLADEALVEERLTSLINQAGGQTNLDAWLAANHYTPESFRADLAIEIEAAWMRAKIAASVPHNAEQVLAREILFYNETDALRVWNQLEGGSTFESRIANYDPQNLGYLGWFPRDYLLEPAIEEVAFSLQPGEYSQVIQTRLGYHIVQVLAREVDRPLSADALLTLQMKALADWLAQKRAASQIEIFLP